MVHRLVPPKSRLLDVNHLLKHKQTGKTGLGGLDVILMIALGKVIKQRAMAPRGHKQQKLVHQGHKL